MQGTENYGKQTRVSIEKLERRLLWKNIILMKKVLDVSIRMK